MYACRLFSDACGFWLVIVSPCRRNARSNDDDDEPLKEKVKSLVISVLFLFFQKSLASR